MWALQTAERQRRDKEEATRYSIRMQDLNIRLPQKPQPARLRLLESEPLDTDLPSGTRSSATDPDCPPGVDLSSMAGLLHNLPTPQQPLTSQYIDTAQHHNDGDQHMSPVLSEFADTRSVSPQIRVEDLQAEASRRVIDGLGNFF